MQFYNQNPIRLIELFAGIGSQAKALKNLGLDFEHWFVCEFDKYAINSYNAIHNTNFTTSDVTKITANDLNITDTEHFTYLLTYSFPCQDLSLAGKRNGMEKGSGTRSGLLWEVERLLNECTQLPQILLMENVPQVHGSKNKEHFDKWIEFLASKGYSNHWRDLNAKDYEIPQSRNRCFMVSILGNYSYNFPSPIPLGKRLRDVMEHKVDERFYLRPEQVNRLLSVPKGSHGPTLLNENSDFARTITTRVGNSGTYEQYIVDNNTPLITLDGETVKVRQATKQGFAIANEGDAIDISYPHSETRRGRVAKAMAHTLTTTQQQVVIEPKVVAGIGEKRSNGGRQWYQQDRIYDDGCAISVTTAFHPYYAIDEPPLRIRKLIPKECWRLMGFDDEDFLKAEKVCSNNQLYHQAGNSIVVNVLMAIFKELFLPTKTRSEWLDELLGDSL